MIKGIISLLRIPQWLKNGFVFLPMFFSGNLASGWCWKESIIMFFSFSFMASGIYCLNDLKDVNEDRKHPQKKHRPLASGQISAGIAIIMMIALIFCSVFFCYLAANDDLYKFFKLFGIIFIYLILNFLYSFGLKHYSLIDVSIIAFGFILRLLSGSFACGIDLSPWIVILTFLLALFLALSKRRDDVILLHKTGRMMRKNIRSYNVSFLNQAMGILAGVMIVCYIMYTLSPEVMDRFNTRYLYLTSVFVLLGILRYLQLTIVDKKSSSPTRILITDRFLQSMVLLWGASFVVILYMR